MTPPESAKPSPRNGLATAAFVVSLFALIPGVGIIAFVLAVFAYRRYRGQRGSAGASLAFFALIVGGLTTVAWIGGGVYMARQVTRLRRLNDSLALYRIDLADGSRHLLFDAPGADTCPAYAPDGKTVYFEHRGPSSFDVWAVDLGTGRAHPLTHLPGDATSPAPSPDGKTVAFRYVYQGRSAIGLVPATGGTPRLHFVRFHDLSGPRFSPDGRSLVLSAIRGGGPSRVRIFPVAGGKATLVAEARKGTARRMNDADPDWEGDRIAFARGEAVVVLDRKTGKLSVPYSGVIARAVHLHGRTLYFASNLVPGKGTKGHTQAHHIVRGDLEGDPASLVVSSPLGIECFDVSPDGRHVAVGLPRKPPAARHR